jgi:hypothetical protein
MVWTATFIGMKSIGKSDATAAIRNKRDISAIVLRREMRFLPEGARGRGPPFVGKSMCPYGFRLPPSCICIRISAGFPNQTSTQ